MTLRSLLLASCAILVPTLASAQTQTPAPQVPSRTQAQPPSSSPPADDENEVESVVITAQRNPNSIPGDAVPETTLAPADIRALGASNVAEILATLGPRVGSGRGRGDGPPVVLLNGRRISGFAEVRNLPSEAILRVEVFPEATALQYGFSAEQRVVNFILRPRFRAKTIEGELGLSANGDRSEDSLEANYLRIREKSRISANLELGKSNAITEAQAGLTRTTGFADSAFRTVLPENQSTAAAVTYTRGLSTNITATFDARASQTISESLLGLRSLGSGAPALQRDNESVNSRLAATLNGQTKGWQWTATASYDGTDDDVSTEIISGATQTAKTQTNRTELVVNGTGPLFKLPAGTVRGSLSTSYLAREIDSQSLRNGVTTLTSLSRDGTLTRANLSVPITSRRGDFGKAFGDFSINANMTLTEASDFGSLQGTGYGLNWSPISDLRFSVNFDQAENAPTLSQLGNPAISTPSSPVFDYRTGQTVLVTRTTGGNPGLLRETRDDVTFSVNYAPTKIEGLDFSLSWSRNQSENVTGNLSGLTADLEAAFPERFTRVGGQLVAIDQRNVNFAETENEILRYGVSYSRSFGKTVAELIAEARARGITVPFGPPGGFGGGPPGGGGGGGGRPPGAGGGGPPGGFGGGGGGGPPTGPTGRWNISVFHTIRLEDSVTLRAGGAALDLLEGNAIDDNGGARRHLVEVEGGWAYLGVGIRANATWRSGTTVDNGAPSLVFDDIFNLNLRAFASTEILRVVTRNAPWARRSRLILRIDNVTDSVQRVRDGNGVTPEAFQRGLIAPRGRFVEIAFRKQF
jgi:outer membrane cobalamin receptor